MNNNPKLTIVIPAHNEEGVIIRTLEDLRKKLTIYCNILVVDDHSTDGTAKLVYKYIQKNKNVDLVGNYGPNRGFSSTLKIGFARSNTEYVLPVMADLCDKPETINRMYSKLTEGWDIICGSRYMKGGSKKGGPKLQNFLSMFVCKTLHLLTGIPTNDVSNAFKIYKKTVLRKVNIRNNAGVEISMEITLQAFFRGAKITEVPTHWKGRTIGQSKFKIIQRTPKYLNIYIWSIKNALKKFLGFSVNPVYKYKN